MHDPGIRVRPLRYWRQHRKDENGRHVRGPISVGQRSYLTKNCHWVIFHQEHGWKIKAYDTLGIGSLSQTFEQTGIYEVTFPTRVAAAHALEVVLEASVY